MGVEIDYLTAAKWYKIAADKGDSNGQFGLGGLYYRGLGAVQNFSQALHSYRQAAAKGNPNAHYMIAVMFEKGQGVEKNLEKAEESFGKAAELNGPEAAFHLAKRLQNGDGLAQSANGLQNGSFTRRSVAISHANLSCNDLLQPRDTTVQSS